MRVFPMLFVAACAAPIEPAPPFRHAALYDWIASQSVHFAVSDGDFTEDFDDSNFYGLAYYTRDAAAPFAAERAAALLSHTRQVLDGAKLLGGDLNEIFMSAFGLIERAEATGDTTDLPRLRKFLSDANNLVELFGYYLELDGLNAWALRIYGPTTMSAMVGVLNLQFARLIDPGDPERAERVAWAKKMWDVVHERAWNGTFYRFSSTRAEQTLYPDIFMILLSGRLAQFDRLAKLGSAAEYEDHARALFDGIQPLRRQDAATGAARYGSSYSAENEGAATSDYSTLSSQNYLTLALLLLYEVTGEARFAEEADRVIDTSDKLLRGDWCLSDVFDDPCDNACSDAQACVANQCVADQCHEGVLHHFIDGRRAARGDNVLFCSGCNLQLQYVMGYRQRLHAER